VLPAIYFRGNIKASGDEELRPNVHKICTKFVSRILDKERKGGREGGREKKDKDYKK
jgi:hypothetical protein